MKINLISKTHKSDNSCSHTFLYDYTSDYIPNVGEYILYGDYKTFFVNEKVFDTRTGTIQLYGKIAEVSDEIIIEAEEFLKYLKKCTEDYLGHFTEVIINPTTGDPRERQYDVSFIVFEKDEKGMIPRFEVNVIDLINSK